MTATIDLDGYFQRIGYTGERRATLDTLCAIHVRHRGTIAFENLNPLLRWPVRLDAPSLEQKLVRFGRGGYCFEQNLLLSHVLTCLGFKVTGLAARVLWNAPEGSIHTRGLQLPLRTSRQRTGSASPVVTRNGVCSRRPVNCEQFSKALFR